MAYIGMVSMDEIFSKIKRDLTDSFSEDSIVEWTGEALESFCSNRYYEEAVAFLEVENYQAKIPRLTKYIIQIARDNQWSKTNIDTNCTPKTIIQETQNIFYSEKDMGYVVLDGVGTPVVEYDIAYYRPYFDLLGEYYGWTNSSIYKNRYSPVGLKDHTFFNSIVCKEYNQSIYSSCQDEYTIVKGICPLLRFSFESGFVAVSLKRYPLEASTGYPLIPDHISYKQAIVSYIGLRMSKKDAFNNRQGANSIKNDYQADWTWYCGQAANIELMPHGIDENQNLMNQDYVIPRRNSYFNFFGNLSTPEIRRFNNSNNRNINVRAIS